MFQLISKRNSNFELLRIISILGIISSHFVRHSGYLDFDPSKNRFIAQFLSMGGGIGVNCFIMISAYFLNKYKFRTKNIVNIMFFTVLYPTITMIIVLCTGWWTISLKTIIMSVFSIPYSAYWYATIFIGFYFLSPFVKQCLEKIEKDFEKKIFITLLIMFCIWPIIILKSDPFVNNLLWFLFIYVFIDYAKKEQSRIWNSKKISGICFFTCLLFMFIIDCGIIMIGTKFVFIKSFLSYFTTRTYLPMLFCSYSLFCFVKNLNIKSNIINIIAGSTFGIYLLHESPALRNNVWTNVFKSNDYFFSDLFIVYAVIVIFLMFVICLIIDTIVRFIIIQITKKQKEPAIFQQIDKWFDQL